LHGVYFRGLGQSLLQRSSVPTKVVFLNVGHLAGGVVAATKSIWFCQVKTWSTPLWVCRWTMTLSCLTFSLYLRRLWVVRLSVM
jgi:hypothetical protein